MLAVLSLSLLALGAYADVTIYTQVTFGAGTRTQGAPQASFTAAAAFDPTSLVAPPVPSPGPNKQFPVQLASGGMNGLSIPQKGNFAGFSVEISVADQVLGENGDNLNPQFLNFLGNIKQRAGSAIVRIGGNSQDNAAFSSDGLPGGATIIQDNSILPGPAESDAPTIRIGIDLIRAMGKISELVNTDWFIGIPFSNMSTASLGIAEAADQILGPRLLGLQAGNEPDLYESHSLRKANYTPFDYIGELTTVAEAIENDSGISSKRLLVAPNTCCAWSPEEVVSAGLLKLAKDLAWIGVEHYPDNNCHMNGDNRTSQSVFPNYLSHKSAMSFVQPFLNISTIALQNQQPLIMMETSTASCGGFPGISDSFGAGLWGVDTMLQMAYANFSAGLFRVAGQNVYYNPFTPPPGNLSSQAYWTVGPMYYSALIVSEVLGRSNASQVVDLAMNNNNELTPGYAIYENGNPTRLALFNYITDPSGASNYTVAISVGGAGSNQPNASPAQVTVRYFTAPSVASQGDFKWGNQTFGGVFESDGTLKGDPHVETIQCDQAANTCSVTVPAPAIALVFLTPQALQDSSPDPAAATTFSTTSTAGTASLHNTATIDAAVLATSNGRGGANDQEGSTSLGSSSARGLSWVLPGAFSLICTAAGAVLVGVIMQ